MRRLLKASDKLPGGQQSVNTEDMNASDHAQLEAGGGVGTSTLSPTNKRPETPKSMTI
jgi:hypothetical protein